MSQQNSDSHRHFLVHHAKNGKIKVNNLKQQKKISQMRHHQNNKSNEVHGE